MNTPNPNREALVRLSRKFAAAGWCDKSVVVDEAFDFELNEVGQARLLQLDAILQELGPLSSEERATLEGLALVFAKRRKHHGGHQS